MTEQGYLLPNAHDAAGLRHRALSALFDPGTFGHLGALGVATGWRCWEVGAGGPSVVRWLADRVGPTGAVLATDLDVSQLEEAAGAGVEVRRHDVAADPPPGAGAFDLVHARLVLVHVPDRDAALAAMVRALRPGGWLVVEDADPALQPLACPDALGEAAERANAIRHGFRALLAERGADLAYGRTLPRLLRTAGLVDVRADAWFPVAHPACRDLELATLAMIGEDLVTHGVTTPDELERHAAVVAAGELDLVQPPMVTAWGRRPEADGPAPRA